MLRLLSCVSAVVLVTASTAAQADPFDWAAATVRTTEFRDSPRAVEVRQGAVSADADAHDIEVVVRWDQGDARREATLYRTICADGAWRFYLHGRRLVATHGACSRFDDEHLEVTHTWSWDPDTDVLGGHRSQRHSPFEEGRAQLRRALDEGRLAEAHAVLARIGTSPNGGHSDFADEIFQELFDATSEVARAAYERGDVAGAAEHLRALFDEAPTASPTCDASPDVVVLLREPIAFKGKCAAFNVLTPTEANLQKLNDAAFYMMKNGNEARALPLLEQILAFAPERAVAHLNRADAFWALGRVDDARPHYEAYVDLREAAGQRVAEYARERQ